MLFCYSSVSDRVQIRISRIMFIIEQDRQYFRADGFAGEQTTF